METNHRPLKWLAPLALAAFTLQPSPTLAQGVTWTNWDNLVTNWTGTNLAMTVPQGTSPRWSGIASSADGTHLAACWGGFRISGGASGGIYTSTNSGGTWTDRTTPSVAAWASIASSADGTVLAVCCSALAPSTNGGIYVSTDAGATWTKGNAPYTVWWTSIASSSDGTQMAATGNAGNYGSPSHFYPGGVFTSTNSGATWTLQVGATNGYSIASSADGTRLVASANTYGYVCTSTNSGVNWTQTSPPCYAFRVASSADGTHLAAAYDGGICTSTDGGVNWTPTRAPSTNWYSIASSADGTKLAAGVDGGGVYVSTDSGANWTVTSGPSSTWTSVAFSADGTQLVATDVDGIWRAQATIQAITPPPLFITQAGNQVILYWQDAGSWTLKQNNALDGSSEWTPSTGVASSNGTNSLTLTDPIGSLFFRLTQ